MKIIDVVDIQNLPARERILLTAQALFYRDGIRAIGVDRLIAESGVAKVTFYRHFPSKNDLIREYLEYRHQRWMEWFVDSLQRHGNNVKAIIPALSEWFSDSGFRGCAFINSVAELGEYMPEIVEITKNHKSDMTIAIENLLPRSRKRAKNAQAIALAIDGAIIRAQFEQDHGEALLVLSRIIKSLMQA